MALCTASAEVQFPFIEKSATAQTPDMVIQEKDAQEGKAERALAFPKPDLQEDPCP
jgi:hypothetical protein